VTHPSIVSVEANTRTIALRQTFSTARRTTDALHVTGVVVTDTSGRKSVGEVTANPHVTGETDATIRGIVEGPLRDALIGLPREPRTVLERAVETSCHGHPSVKAAAWIATAGLTLGHNPAATLLGTATDAVRTAITVSAASPDDMARTARERIGAGFTTLKAKLSGPPDRDIDRLVALRDILTDHPGTDLWLDSNQRWNAPETLQVLNAWDRVSDHTPLTWVEQPCPASDLGALQWIAERTHHPVLADEAVHTASDVLAAARAGAAGVNIKVAKAGSLTAALSQAHTAHAAGLLAVVGCMMESPQALLPGLAVAAALAPCITHDLDAAWWLHDTEDLTYERGTVRARCQ
jgi:L-alanine-DL-glutamate epimerase-like enolase superfamily enzyme